MYFNSLASRCCRSGIPKCRYQWLIQKQKPSTWKDICIVSQAEKYKLCMVLTKITFSYEVVRIELILEINFRCIEIDLLKPRTGSWDQSSSLWSWQKTYCSFHMHLQSEINVKTDFYQPFWFMLSAYCTWASLSFDRISRASRWDKPWNSSKSSP